MDNQDLGIIRNNPYRVLGVYSNSPKKEIVANTGKLKAFAKTNKSISFDSDFTIILGPVNRSIESINQANNDLSLPKDKLTAGLFWFMNDSENTELAFKYLNQKDFKNAINVLTKENNLTGRINAGVISLIEGKWDFGLYCYNAIFNTKKCRTDLLKLFSDSEEFLTDEKLADFITYSLLKFFPDVNWLEITQQKEIEFNGKLHQYKEYICNSLFYKTFVKACIKNAKEEIEEILEKAKSTNKNDARKNLSVAEELERVTKPLLRGLKLATNKSENDYVKYADMVANQIIDNCIDYYNHDADNPKRAQNVIKYTRYAYRTAESKTAKERAKKNLDILNEVLENTIPASIREEYDNINRQVTFFKANESKIDYCDSLSTIILYCCSQLQTIESKLGSNNRHYLAISTDFGLFADQAIIKHVNSFLSSIGFKTTTPLPLYNLRAAHKCLKWANSMYGKLDVISFTDDFSANSPVKRYLINRSYVEKLSKRFEKELNEHPLFKTVIPSSSTRINSQNGTNKVINRNRPSQAASPIANNRQPENDNSAIYIFGGFALIVVVVLLIIWGTNNNTTDSSREKVQSEKPYEEHTITGEESTDYRSSSNSEYSTDAYSSNETESPSSYSNDNDQQMVEQVEEPINTVHFSTGDRPYKSTYGKGNYNRESLNSLKIKNGSSTDAVVFLERLNGRKVRHVFISRGENFTMSQIPGGQYIIKVMQGTDWNPDKDNGEGNPKGGFMYSCSISKSEPYDPFIFPDPSSGKYSQGEITLYKVQNGNMQTEAINENDLF